MLIILGFAVIIPIPILKTTFTFGCSGVISTSPPPFPPIMLKSTRCFPVVVVIVVSSPTPNEPTRLLSINTFAGTNAAAIPPSLLKTMLAVLPFSSTVAPHLLQNLQIPAAHIPAG